MNLIIASATREPDEDAFMANTPLGKSLQKLRALVQFKVKLACNRSDGLPKFYNEVIEAADEDDVFAFVHDDYAILDTFFAEKLSAAFKEFHVIGVAGCRTPDDKLPLRWHHPDHEPSGTIANNTASKEDFISHHMICFGQTPARSVAMDGVFLATHKKALDAVKLRFDERFDYHHYDLQFTILAARLGLKLGTWPIYGVHCCTQGSGYGSKEWRDSCEVYRQWAAETLK